MAGADPDKAEFLGASDALAGKTMGVVGLGLIGGSFARGFAACGARVLAYDTNDDILAAARIDTVADVLCDDNLAECDLIVLAAYPAACVDWIKEHAAALASVTDIEAIKGPIVVDTSGVKEAVCNEAFELARANKFFFVGTHPMAGTQFSGYAHSRATLFCDAPLVLVPPAMDDILKLELLDRITQATKPLGFTTYCVTTPAVHDRVIAFTSQLCHVVSNAYVKSPTAQEHHGFSAGSYRDLTRVAHLNPAMWSELMMENAEPLAYEIDTIVSALTAYSDALKAGDRDQLQELLAEGDRIKRALDDAKK